MAVRSARTSDHLLNDLFRRARAGDAAARERLVTEHLGLARALAVRMAGRTEALDDLVQVASLGLLRAIDRYEPDRGVAFSSFAVPTILGELRRHLRDRSWAVRPPRRVQELWLEVGAARVRLESRLGREATARELAAETGCVLEDVLEALEAARGLSPASLDAPVSDGEPGGASVGELSGGVDGGYGEVDARLTLAMAARDLTARQRAVLWLQVTEDLTQEEIARRVGVSQMQVSRDLRAARQAVEGWFHDGRAA
jgi:RNA polymerase sigma-B factor